MTETGAFSRFWDAWPANGQPPFAENVRKKNRVGCQKKWKANKLDDLADTIIRDVQQRSKYDKSWKSNAGKFMPLPLTYLNQRQWEDGGFADVRDDRKKLSKPTANLPEYTGPECSRYMRYANLYLLKSIFRIGGLQNNPLLAEIVKAKNQVVKQAETEGDWEDDDFTEVVRKTIDDGITRGTEQKAA